MVLVKPVSTPMAPSTTLSRFEGSTITDTTLYRNTVGSLQYLSLTCPDIAFAVNKVSQFMQDPWNTLVCSEAYLALFEVYHFSYFLHSQKLLQATHCLLGF
jgi:hypothetical protein